MKEFRLPNEALTLSLQVISVGGFVLSFLLLLFDVWNSHVMFMLLIFCVLLFPYALLRERYRDHIGAFIEVSSALGLRGDITAQLELVDDILRNEAEKVKNRCDEYARRLRSNAQEGSISSFAIIVRSTDSRDLTRSFDVLRDAFVFLGYDAESVEHYLICKK